MSYLLIILSHTVITGTHVVGKKQSSPNNLICIRFAIYIMRSRKVQGCIIKTLKVRNHTFFQSFQIGAPSYVQSNWTKVESFMHKQANDFLNSIHDWCISRWLLKVIWDDILPFEEVICEMYRPFPCSITYHQVARAT